MRAATVSYSLRGKAVKAARIQDVVPTTRTSHCRPGFEETFDQLAIVSVGELVDEPSGAVLLAKTA